MNIGEKIRQKRIELNMSQDELAKKVGYRSRSSIQKIESSRNLPLKKVTKMAQALGCSESYLMGWETLSGHTPPVEVAVLPENIDSDRVAEAMEFLALYDKASPSVQAAIQTLLKGPQSES